jgi:hypothetical protein
LRIFGVPNGIRTRVAALKARCPRPTRRWGRGASLCHFDGWIARRARCKSARQMQKGPRGGTAGSGQHPELPLLRRSLDSPARPNGRIMTPAVRPAHRATAIRIIDTQSIPGRSCHEEEHGECRSGSKDNPGSCCALSVPRGQDFWCPGRHPGYSRDRVSGYQRYRVLPGLCASKDFDDKEAVVSCLE